MLGSKSGPPNAEIEPHGSAWYLYLTPSAMLHSGVIHADCTSSLS